MGKRLLVILAVLSFALPLLTADKSFAVPSFARQTGRPCSGCHTVWPRLNITGREFKVTGYTDIADDTKRVQGDRLDLLRFVPLSISIISFPFQKVSGEDGETLIPDEVAIFYAGRITPNIGAFIEPVWSRDGGDFELEFAKLNAAMRVGPGNTIGLVLGKMDAGGADPFNTIRFTAYHTVNSPGIFSQERASGDFFQFGSTDNQGAVVNGEFRVSRYLVYAAMGVFRGHESTDPVDFYARINGETFIGGLHDIALGGFVYSGREEYDDPLGGRYKSDVLRAGADLQYQIESGPHIIDAVAVYMGGKDKDLDGVSGNDVSFDGFYGEASYFYQRTYGVTIGYDYMASDDDDSLDKNGWVFNVSCLPWLNTKLALEYSNFDVAGGDNEETVSLLVHLYF